MQRHAFRAMGTDVELLLAADRSLESSLALDAAEREFARLEALLSRFRPTSELSVLNRDGAIDAGPDLIAVATLAVEARERTSGRFDPTVHDALVAAGYDRTFETIAPECEDACGRPCGGEVLIHDNRITVEHGFRLDLGGIAKGYAVDRACTILAGAGPCLVNAGGDLAGRGRLWPVGVETATETISLGLRDGALATSGQDRRRWRRGEAEMHHLIDPTTGRPAVSELLRVTAFAPSAVEAEIVAKAIFLGAPAETPSVLVTRDGRTLMRGGLG
jgi:thiamine biosynthesis lipoprotein